MLAPPVLDAKSAVAPPRPADPAIRVSDITHVYAARDGGRIEALKNVSFECRQGEFVSLIGPSGCGKSTLLRLLAGLARPTTGQLFVQGKEIKGPTDDIAMVFQKSVLLPWRTVLENCLLPVQIRRLPVAQYKPKALELLELVGLGGFASKYPSELSGGMQQRNSIARALITEPRHMLFDEPFGALDALTRDKMAVELQKIWLNKGPAIVFVTHSIAEAVFLSDRIVIMSARPGRIVTTLDVDLARPRTIDIYSDPKFGNLVNTARKHLEES